MAVTLLGLTVLAGLLGSPSPIANIGPTLFWVGLMLALTAATALAGDIFRVVNPWRALCDWFADRGHSRLPYPRALSLWPAFVFYLGLAWLELLAPPRPSLLSMALILYTGLTLCGAALFGREVWFEQAEFFGVFFRTVGTMSPVAMSMSAAVGGAQPAARRSRVPSRTCRPTSAGPVRAVHARGDDVRRRLADLVLGGALLGQSMRLAGSALG